MIEHFHSDRQSSTTPMWRIINNNKLINIEWLHRHIIIINLDDQWDALPGVSIYTTLKQYKENKIFGLHIIVRLIFPKKMNMIQSPLEHWFANCGSILLLLSPTISWRSRNFVFCFNNLETRGRENTCQVTSGPRGESWKNTAVHCYFSYSSVMYMYLTRKFKNCFRNQTSLFSELLLI